MCVITNTEDVVVSISLIPGVGTILEGYHVYFPVKANELPQVGDVYKGPDA